MFVKMKRVGATLEPVGATLKPTLETLGKDVLSLLLQHVNCARSLCVLSAVSRRFRDLVAYNTVVWSRLLRSRMGLSEPQATMKDFGEAAVQHVWDWNDVFGDAVFWAQLVYAHMDVTNLFLREFSDTPVSAQLRKVQEHDTGLHSAELDLGRGGYVLQIGTGWGCCLLLRIERAGRAATLMRVDGHPGGCGLSLEEAKTLFRLARGRGGFDDKYLWPLLWVVICELPEERRARLALLSANSVALVPPAAAVEWLEPRLREAWRGLIADEAKMEELIADITAHFDRRCTWERSPEDSEFLADLFRVQE